MKRLEYIWLDGNDTPQLRSKTRFAEEITEWNFDGGSTKQGSLEDSDRMLKPVRSYKDPFVDGYLVLCEVCYHDGTPHESNSRNALMSLDTSKYDPWFGLEQEVTFLLPETRQPLGMLLQPEEQGPYYCGVGRMNAVGRDIMTEFEERCSNAGISLGGINAEVMPGQWEFQTTAQAPVRVSDDLWVARYILARISEEKGVEVSYDPKPHSEFNGAGCHVNFSTNKMRHSFTDLMIEDFMRCLEEDHDEHIKVCGDGIERRMTGECETSDYQKFTWGVSDRGASVRIPQKVNTEGRGYIEDRRPCANIDPYKVVFSLLSTTKKSNVL